MAGRNRGVCHSCRCPGHFFADCPNKRSCPWCKDAFIKCFEVEKDTKNKGKLFKCCSSNCGFWDWVKESEASCESKSVSITSTTAVATEAAKQICGMFENQCRLTDEHVVEVSVTVRVRSPRVEGEDKGKGKA